MPPPSANSLDDEAAPEPARRQTDARPRTGVLGILKEFSLSSAPLEDQLPFMASRIQTLMRASGAEVDLLQDDQLVCHGAVGTTVRNVGMISSLEGLSGLAVRSLKPAVSTDVANDERVHPLARSLGIRSVAVMPMLGGTDVVGVIRVSYDEEYIFEDRELLVLQMLAITMGNIIVRRRSVDALTKSEQRYRLMFERNPQAMYVYDPRTLLVVAVNDSAVQRYGYSVAEFVGKSLTQLAAPEEMEEVDRAVKSLSLFERTTNLRRRHKHKDGTVIDVELSGDAIVFDGRPARLVHVADITDRVRAEQEILRLARTQHMLSACNQAVIRTQDRESLLNKVCEIAVEIGGYRAAWVGLAQDDDNKSVMPVAVAGPGAEAILDFKFTWSESSATGQGTVGRAVREQRITSVRDIRQESAPHLWDDIRKHFDARGIISLPLRDGHAHRAFGVLGLYAREPVSPGSEELVRMEELADNLAYGITMLQAKDDKVFAEQAVYQAAHYDSLTGLPNRRSFESRLQDAVSSAVAAEQCGAVLFLNIANFATINKTLGHANGDSLLRQVAQRLRQRLQNTAISARAGGDEFLVLMPHFGPDSADTRREAANVANGLLDELARPFELGSYEQKISASVGIAMYGFEGVTATDEILHHADLALTQARKEGRRAIVFFDPSLQRVLADRTALEADLAQAMARDELELHYQPQVSRGGLVIGAEALIRWRSPKRGLVSPANFIPLAEETGLILSIGQWVIESACAVLASWKVRRETRDLTIAVNVSLAQFRQRNFVRLVSDALHASGASPTRLKLELTESMLADDIDEVIDKMRALRSIGVGFSMDDFGTGYSSLAYLKRMPLDQLKIDQSFVRELFTDPNGAAIAKTIIALAGSMGLMVIAEGVETAEQKDWLFTHDCDAFQGYLFSRPVPLQQLEALLIATGNTGP